jgi:hypothetical protein
MEIMNKRNNKIMELRFTYFLYSDGRVKMVERYYSRVTFMPCAALLVSAAIQPSYVFVSAVLATYSSSNIEIGMHLSAQDQK